MEGRWFACFGRSSRASSCRSRHHARSSSTWQTAGVATTSRHIALGEDGALTPVPGSPFPAGNLPASVAVDPTGKFAYVVNEGGNNVSAYRIGKNGALTPIPGSPFLTETDPHEVAVDPRGKFVYVANAVSNNISAYRIGKNGALTPIPGSPFAAGSFPRSVAVDPGGTFVYAANQVEQRRLGVPHR